MGVLPIFFFTTKKKNPSHRGGGGGQFPMGIKWEIASKQHCREKYFICNLDESEPGTYKDRILAEKSPHQIIEGILIGAYAVGARKGYIYINGNFSTAQYLLKHAIDEAHAHQFLGKCIMGSLFDFDLELFVGAGAYICGEETALINSIEGRRGEPRGKPPFTCACGLNNKPTVVNNAETISNVPWIINNGGDKYATIGLKNSPGTKLFCVDGSVKHPGIYEKPIGTSVRELIFNAGGGMIAGTEFRFAQIGGSSGHLIPQGLLDEQPQYGKNPKVSMGSGAILVIDKNQDIKKLLLSWIRFFQRESCGKCVPCREGTFRLKAIIERLNNGNFDQNDKEDLHKLIWTLNNTTFCLLGKFSVTALQDVIKYKLLKDIL
ncbi:MAG: NADH-ubiquinone oxidoreductase-F iron-sulfur binding region domain-containing protein [Patescibacteria group bacterium]|nr:NADH-ubiquinone oxidoreductase-F iron-sulfur binding region domain-containing protein [Patescibacteria group bacterium]